MTLNFDLRCLDWYPVKVSEHGHWCSLQSIMSNPRSILSYDALILRSEMDIFYSCLNWLQSGDTKERNKYLDRVMDCVRFPLMNHAMLYECVEKCSLLKSSTSCIQKIHEANWYVTFTNVSYSRFLKCFIHFSYICNIHLKESF